LKVYEAAPVGRRNIGITPSHLTGLIAVTISIYFLIMHRDDLAIVAASIYFVLACSTDTIKSKIPNILNLCLLIAGFSINIMAMGLQGFLASLAGLGLGIGLLLLPYLLGGMGAGDVKALGALGALIGPISILHVFVYMGLFGGGFALLHYFFQGDLKHSLREGWQSVCAAALTRKADYILPRTSGTQRESLRFPYSAAIALGYYSFVYWGGIL
jgi:prepilin peptidase CpaA